MNNKKTGMGLGSCVGLIIGACVGSAIFSLSGITIYYAGASAILSWVLAALIYGMYGIIVTSLAEAYPRSGGIYVFPRLAIGGYWGRFAAFMSAWGYIVSNIIAVAFSAIYIGVYVQAGFPTVNGGAVSVASLLLSLVILLIRARRSQKIQNVLVFVLVAALLLFCGIAFLPANFCAPHFAGFFTGGIKGCTGFINAIPLAMVAYGGCVAIAFVASEVRKPEKNVRRSLIIGLGAVMLLYATFMAALVCTLPPSVLHENEGLRYIPAFASITHGSLKAYPWLTRLLSLCGTLALLTTVIALTRINARAVQAMSAEGLLPRVLSHEKGSSNPDAAYAILTSICLVLCLFQRYIDLLINLGAVLNIASMTITCIAAIYGPYSKGRKFLFPVSVSLLLWACYLPDLRGGHADMWVFTGIVYAVGLVVYLLRRYFHRFS